MATPPRLPDPLWRSKILARLEVLSELDRLREENSPLLPKDTAMTYEQWEQQLVRDPRIKGGTTVFPNSRLAVRRVGGSLMYGEKTVYLLEDYPHLTRQDLLYSIDYAHREGLDTCSSSCWMKLSPQSKSPSRTEKLTNAARP